MPLYPFDYATVSNLPVIESLYQQFLADRESVDPSWHHFFEGMAFAGAGNDLSTSVEGVASGGSIEGLVDAYIRFGVRAAKANPFLTPETIQQLTPSFHGFSQADLDAIFPTFGVLAVKEAPLRVIIETLQKNYCGSIGYEFMHVESKEVYSFIENAIANRAPISKEQRIYLLDGMIRAEMLESFIHKNYTGAKRFSLEGGEPLIPMLWLMADIGAEEKLEHVIIGMAHRGRLNVLANVMNKPFEDIFYEFEPSYRPPFQNVSGDVKYHLGYKRDYKTKSGGTVHMQLMPNPSHLESVNAPTTGFVRALQESIESEKGALALIIHGDAAVAGQGIVYETMQLSNITGYSVGGTVHVIINNQIGFTASPEETKSTRYCSDVAKGFGFPVFHVSVDDPEGCLFATELAIKIRQRFGLDSFIELNCYRKYGHNEGDEPRFTNPKLYNEISKKTPPLATYIQFLQSNKIISDEEIVQLQETCKKELEDALAKAKSKSPQPPIEPKVDQSLPVATSIPQELLASLMQQLATVPASVQIHPKIRRIIEDRVKMATGEMPIDWGAAEAFAFASLINEGIAIRLSGQDCCRATFSHRHAAIVDQVTEEKYIPLKALATPPKFQVYNSILSELAVLGFEWGYNMHNPKKCTIWEAQYGDFSNGAQIIIDQYIVSSEQKWNCETSLILLLPHGYEGSGPEHSSARLERFLQLSACDNIRVCVPSTAAQYFHLLRRQALTPLKKPLIVFTPKALLRYAPALSDIKEITAGGFSAVIQDPTPPIKAKKAIICSGKVYYDLLQHRNNNPEIAIIRIEQLYPFPKEMLKQAVSMYPNLQEITWVQEEHKNMGAWLYIFPLLHEHFSAKLRISYAGRAPSSSTAAGAGFLHNLELESLLKEAFA